MARSNNLFKDNILYLFELNKKINNQKISNFINETKISRAVTYIWKHQNVEPHPSNLKSIITYFNKWLKLELTSENLLYDNIKTTMVDRTARLLKKHKIVSDQSFKYNNKMERELLACFKLLDPKKQKAVLNLIKDLL